MCLKSNSVIYGQHFKKVVLNARVFAEITKHHWHIYQRYTCNYVALIELPSALVRKVRSVTKLQLRSKINELI